MVKNSFVWFLGGGLTFYFVTLLSLSFGFDLARANLLVAVVLALLCNVGGLLGERKRVLWCLGAIFYVLTFFVSAKIWGVWLFVFFCLSAYFLNKKQLSKEDTGLLMIFCATFFNLSFVTNTSIEDVQHDFPSCFNYIEYILENNFLFWRENPLLNRPSYSSYHPFLHFFLAAIYFKFSMFFGFSKTLSAEAAQVMFCFYLFWYYLLAAKILQRLDLDRTTYLTGLCFVIFFPTYNSIAGFFNNDCLLLPLQAGTLYFSLCYYQDGGRKNLWLLFLFATVASLTKLSGILVLPVVGLMMFFRLWEKRDIKTLKEVLFFGILIVLGIMIWPFYQYFWLNLPFFDYVPDMSSLSLSKYTLWERFNPVKAFVYEDMFFHDFGINLWETLTKTALFGEWDFSFKNRDIFFLLPLMVFLYKLILGLSIVLAVYLSFFAKDKKMLWFFVVLVLSLFLGEVVFLMKHPFMCNQDFRYIAILPLGLTGILTIRAEKLYFLRKAFPLIIAFSLCATIVWWRVSF